MRGRESRWARAASWRERGGSERVHGEERVDSTVNEGRFQGGEEGQAGEWTQKLSRTICRVLVSLLVWPILK